MTGSVALDVVIGLVFIYTLYSLFTSVLTEIIAGWFQLRGKFLAKGIKRMLDDGSGNEIFSKNFFDQPLIKYLARGRLKLENKPSYMTSQNFSKNLMEVLKTEAQAIEIECISVLRRIKDELDQMPGDENIMNKVKEIKKKLSQIIDNSYKAGRPSVTVSAGIDEVEKIIDDLDEKGKKVIKEVIDKARVSLKESGELKLSDIPGQIRSVLSDPQSRFAKSETVKFILSLLDDAQNDLEKFKTYLEKWYDDTMERVTGWYKRRIQLVTFLIGLGVAIVFNADTLTIVNSLSVDPKARDQMVQMATAYIENHPAPPAGNKDTVARDGTLDSLMKVKEEIEKDIAAANSVLGLGWDFPGSLKLYSKKDSISDFLRIKVDSIGTVRFIRLTPALSKKIVTKLLVNKDDTFFGYLFPFIASNSPDNFVRCVNANYSSVRLSKWKFFWTSFWGFILTAIALSLGAPFWFDLLNKLVKLRTSVQPAAQSQPAKQSKGQETTLPSINRVG